MSRPRLTRQLRFQPKVTYFKPAGVPLRSLSEIVLADDEIEAIKLYDHEQLDQTQVAKSMGISQPTVARILKSAYHKIALALIEGKAIRIKQV